jgi:hypothetical protein
LSERKYKYINNMVVDVLINTRSLLLEDKAKDSVNYPEISISSNLEFRKDVFYDTLGIEELGTLNVLSPSQKYAFGYTAHDLTYIADNQSHGEKIVALAGHAITLQGWFNNFLFLLWFAKDNSISADFVYIRSNPQIFPSVNTVSINYITMCNNACEQTETIFSEMEINYVYEIQKLIKTICPGDKNMTEEQKPTIEDIDSPTKLFVNADIQYHDYNRLEKALLFLSRARGEMHLLSKIAAYCSIFECLFSTEKTDINYKISQRIGLYIGNDYDERIYLKKLVSDAYNIRSRYIHGNAISRKDLKETGDFNKKNLLRVSREVDNLLRIIITRIVLGDHEIFNDDDKLISFFDTLIFNNFT